MKYLCVGEGFKGESFEEEIEADTLEQARHEFLHNRDDLMRIVQIHCLGSDSVNHPSHYTQGGIECIEAIKSATVNLKGIEAVCTANAIKYLWRWKEKNGLVDLKKCKWYVERLIEELGDGD